jgi:hypothetical protein
LTDDIDAATKGVRRDKISPSLLGNLSSPQQAAETLTPAPANASFGQLFVVKMVINTGGGIKVGMILT